MAQSASLMYTFGDTSSLAPVAPSTGFGSSATTFPALIRDQIFGSSLAIILVGLGTPVAGGALRFTEFQSAAAQAAQLPEALTLPSRIELVQISEPETTGCAALSVEFGESTTTTPERSSGLARSLRDLDDFSSDDWDAEGGRRIAQEVIVEAARLLDLLPDGMPEPDVAPSSDGSVCMEWENAAGTLWLDIEADLTARMLVVFGDKKQEMLFRVDDPKLPTYLRHAASRLYANSGRLAIRSIMVPT